MIPIMRSNRRHFTGCLDLWMLRLPQRGHRRSDITLMMA
jgi:hypothetical protein